MKKTSLKVKCEDGVELTANLFAPTHPKAAVMMSGATAVPKEFYFSFAAYLVERNYAVICYDYRGVCSSQPEGGLKKCEYEYLDWGMKDMPAVMNYLAEQFPNIPKLIVGHSVGGQKFGMMPNHKEVSGMVTFASSAGYWGYMPLAYRLQTHFFFDIFRPLSNWFYGYTAAKKLNLMEDLPKNVTNAWRNWCSVPEYFFDKKYYADTAAKGFYDQIEFPIQLYWSTDDNIVNQRSVDAFWKHVKSSKGVELAKITPDEFGVKSIGHFGLFRRKFKETLWPLVLNKLDEFHETAKP
jgi:predicted alpha/beta hydrolase